MSATTPRSEAPAARAPRWLRYRRQWRARSRPLRLALRALMVATLFVASLVPLVLVLFDELSPADQAALAAAAARARTAPVVGETYVAVERWYAENVVPVQELRPLAPLPSRWEGRWVDSDKNYAAFERWFADHLGLRNLMIRSKNELDYQLFRSSRRVYYGANGELYGRNMADHELPRTEIELTTPAKRDAALRGVRRLAAELKEAGVTLVLMTPIAKQYFTRERLPFFAPRVGDDSHFLDLYARMKDVPELHFIDIRQMMLERQGKLPIFYRQDFHWTDLMAMEVASATVERIARLEGSAVRWRHPLRPVMATFLGVEERFAARLNAADRQSEAMPATTWTAVHRRQTLAEADGYEFETDSLPGPAMLPPACMYGNSFSDGMLRAGLDEHFEKFTKLSRHHDVRTIVPLVRGRCKYLIVQLLDIQANAWAGFAQ